MIRIHTMMMAAVLAAAAVPAMAQNQEGLVNVNLSDIVVQDIANNLNVQIDVVKQALNGNTIQLPIGIAATVCGVTANVLANPEGGGTATCDAKNTSQALDQRVKRMLP